MDVPTIIFLAALFACIIGIIGGQVMTWLCDRSEHPPNREKDNKKGGNSDGRN